MNTMPSGSFLSCVHYQAVSNSDSLAMVSDEQSLTYGQLWRESDSLAAYILDHSCDNTAPIAVYGHKSPLMLVCFLAAVKSGHPYVPIDASVPDSRVLDILSQTKGDVFAVSDFEHPSAITNERIREALKEYDGRSASQKYWVSDDDIFYILFTSGSTGSPKGVKVTERCVSRFFPWALSLGNTDKTGQTFINQAPFSFDLSVYELCMSLASGGTLFCLTKEKQENSRLLFETLAQSCAEVWVSTPSFADMCLADMSFCENLLPNLEVFIFCGETLFPSTARKLRERFPDAKVVNTYGPTESTVAVTEIEIDAKLIDSGEPLPVGFTKPGTRILIWDKDGKELEGGEQGEIVIAGDTVSAGYYNRDDLSNKVFGYLADGTRYYKTGDKGYVDDDGCLHYIGRLDLQIKLNGYRIELGDIEKNIQKLPYVSSVVALPAFRNGKISHIAAIVCLNRAIAESDFKTGLRIKEDLKETLPHYMIPRKIVIKESLPTTNNGKVDRKALQEELG
ncbi:MAG: D-alanine--poly(phosphoribitol) ligase subunit DltA [Actinobacteria bacterium]|nr:D-alanine--poly(phosphoribitol) ligase subunit DltA [Actinomycetota bacterium]